MYLPLHYTVKEILEYDRHQRSHLKRLNQIKSAHLSVATDSDGEHFRLLSNNIRCRYNKAIQECRSIDNENRKINIQISRETKRPIREQFKPIRKALARHREIRSRTTTDQYDRSMDNLRLIKRLIDIQPAKQLTLKQNKKDQELHNQRMLRISKFSAVNQKRKLLQLRELGFYIPVKKTAKKH